jgi:predicted DNA-binding transcriptional regulator AlpA
MQNTFNSKNHSETPDRLIRLREVLEIIPVGRSSWWLGVRQGRYPKPIKLGPRTTCWRESEVRRLVNGG